MFFKDSAKVVRTPILRYTNAELKISLHVHAQIKMIP